MFAEAGIACASSGAPSTYEDRTEAALFRENRALILVAGPASMPLSRGLMKTVFEVRAYDFAGEPICEKQYMCLP